jgi:peptidase MA superfamily protein
VARSNVQAAVDTVPVRLDGGRFSVYAIPRDDRLARALLAAAVQHDTFPGLPRPTAHVVIAVAPDAAHFLSWVGPAAPEWGAAVAFPDRQRIVVQGGRAGSSAGDPVVTLRHELAHLALHEFLDGEVPRWFDEGYASYAAREQMRDEILATNVALALRGVPTFASLDSGLVGREGDAVVSYALAYRAVSDLAALDPARGLSLFFAYWRSSGSLDLAVRRAYGLPLDRFEAQWRSRTRRRYGALAVASDLAFATVVFLILLAPLYVARRRRDRARLEALRMAERAAEANAANAVPAPAEDGPPHRGAGGALA